MSASLRSVIIQWQGSRSEVEAARQLGVAPNTISNWKDGKSLPSRLVLPPLAQALGIGADDLRALVEVERARRLGDSA